MKENMHAYKEHSKISHTAGIGYINIYMYVYVCINMHSRKRENEKEKKHEGKERIQQTKQKER